jgi:DNA-binding winged helix-turn-helix (wHTH) protein/tetratricopeptide (TPR) repeat protein
LDQSPIILAHEEPFSMGPAEARPATRELCNGDRVAVLEPRVMQLLVALHRARGLVVSKDDLVALCWGGRIVGEDAINRVVSRLRHDLAKVTGDAVRIETITKVGYRLHAHGKGQPGGIALTSADRMDRRRMVLMGTAAVGAAAIGGLAWQRSHSDDLTPEARALIAKGRASMDENTLDQLSNAVAQFRQATTIAPDSAEAWGTLALAYRILSKIAPRDQSVQYSARSHDAAQRALSLDPGTGDAVAAEVLSVPMYRNWLAFEQRCRPALGRFPKHPVLHEVLGNFLCEVGRTRESLMHVERAIRYGGRTPVRCMYKAWLLEDLGRIEDADRAFDDAFRVWPRHYAIWFTRLYHLAQYGRPAEALAMIDGPNRPVGIPEWNFAMTRLQIVAMQTRRPDDIAAAVKALVDGAHKGTGFAENAIIFAGAVGSIDAAFAVADAYFFDRGFTVGERRFSDEQGMYTAMRRRHTYMLFRGPAAPLRSDVRFNSLVRAVGLEDYWAKSHKQPDYRG